MDKRMYLTDLTAIIDISKIANYTYCKALDLRTVENEQHDFWQLRYVNSGKLCYELDGEMYTICSGQLFLFPPHIKQKVLVDRSEQGPEIIVTGFVSNSEALWQLAKKTISVSHEEKKLLYSIIKRKKDLFEFISNDPDYRGIKPKENISQGALQVLKINHEKLLISLYERICVEGTQLYGKNKQNRDSEFVEDIKRYLEENVPRNLTLKEIAEHFSYSQSSLKNIFKRVTGESTMQYYNSLKLEKAKELIRESSLTITQIAEMLGYTTTSYFSQVFKEATGVTPSQYSKKNLNN